MLKIIFDNNLSVEKIMQRVVFYFWVASLVYDIVGLGISDCKI
jgi:hypothetical protein